MDNAAITPKVASTTEEERMARGEELIRKPGNMSRDELLEFAKLILGEDMKPTDPA